MTTPVALAVPRFSAVSPRQPGYFTDKRLWEQ